MDYFPSSLTGASDSVPYTQTQTVRREAGGLAHPDLITFLAAAQKYNVEFVPVVWQEALGLLGKGGTADINQLMLHTHGYDPQKKSRPVDMSFAFKRVSEYQSEGGVTESSNLYEVLTMELVVLSQQAIRNHPNIVDLEGICWEITDTNRIYPVLLFEKGNWGDLGYFAMGLSGDYCTFNAKLGFCVDIARALQIMHGLNIVHGDIKPQNVLVFDLEPNVQAYVTGGRVKLTDFGYSCFGAQDSDIVYLPFSDVWSAPEYHDRGFELGAAKKADIFGFGLTAVYLLFFWEVWDSRFTWAPMKRKMRDYIQDGSMLRWVQKAIGEYYDKDHELQGATLFQFFNVTLAHESGARETDMEKLIQLLRQAEISSSVPVFAKNRYRAPPKAELVQKVVTSQPHLFKSPSVPRPIVSRVQGANTTDAAPPQNPSVFQPNVGRAKRILGAVRSYETKAPNFNSKSLVRLLHGTRRNVDDIPLSENMGRLQSHLSWEDVSHEDFSISKMMMGLLLTDYRVRQEICSALLTRFDTLATLLGHCEPCLRNTAFQLALCYKLGFGTPADKDRAVNYLAASRKPESDLCDEILKVKQLSGFGFVDLQSRPAKFVSDGIIYVWTFVYEYPRKGLKLREVQDYHLREYMDMEKVLGNESEILGTLKAVQAKIYTVEGDLKNAERLQRELLQSCIRKSGDIGLDTLYAKQNLGATLLNAGELDEGEVLSKSAFAGMSTILGEGHLSTMAAQNQWCETLNMRGRHEEAMQTYKAIYEKTIEILGAEHPNSLVAMANWGSALGAMGDFEFSKTLHSLVSQDMEKVLGPTHEMTLNSKTRLASALRHLGSYAEAEKIHRSTLDALDDAVGPSRKCVTRMLEEYALTLEVQRKFLKAGRLRRRARGLVFDMKIDALIEDDNE